MASIGTYKGVEVSAGTDAEVARQMAEIDKKQSQTAAPTQPVSVTPTSISDLTKKTNELLGGNYFDASTGKQVAQYVPKPVPATTGVPAQTQAPQVPVQEAPAVQNAYISGVSTQAQAADKALQDAYKARSEQLAAEKAYQQKAYEDALASQKTAIDQTGNVASEKQRMKLDALATETRRFDENYNTVQGLAKQLQDLMTEGNQLIAQQKGQTGLSAIMTPRINKTISDVAASAGVIQAGISVYNGQMSQAQSQLQSAVNAIDSAYSDTMEYYKTLSNFYGNKAQTEDAKSAITSKAQMEYADKQVALAEQKRNETQKSMEAIKQAMMDPDKALLYASAGVKLTDSVEEINRKVAEAAYSKEISQISQKMAAEGYTFLPEGGNAPIGSAVFQVVDSQGNVKEYYKKAAGTSAVSGAAATDNPVVLAWAERIQSGQAKITDIPASQASLRNSVALALQQMGNDQNGKPTVTEMGKAALSTANSLLQKIKERKGTSAIGKTGMLGSFGYGLIPGTDRANLVSDFNSLKSQLSFEGIKYLKGQGQVSDAERALLASAVTKLNLSQSEPEFKSTLEGIINRLSGTPESSLQTVSPSDKMFDQLYNKYGGQ